MQSDWCQNLSPGRIATMACLLEVAAPKPGNVHRGADFEDTTLNDFLASAVAFGNSIDANADQPLGKTVLDAVRQTGLVADSNTNLGLILLITPLAKCRETPLDPSAVQRKLQNLTGEDGRDVYEAIRLANPGGLGHSPACDVRDGPVARVDLLQAMEISANRDRVAKQFVTGFADVFGPVLEHLEDGKSRFSDLSQAIVYAHVRTMALFPDSLIARKCGMGIARQSQQMAQQALDRLHSGGSSGEFWKAVGDLDFWLRCDGHRRNPGTTADLIAAAIFVSLRNGTLQPPF